MRQAGDTRYKYDAEGNLVRKTLADGKTWHYGWNGAGQLVEVKRPDGYAITFAYDAFGRRVSKRFRGKVTRWVWDGDKPLHEWAELEVGPGAGSIEDLTTWLFEDDGFTPTAKLAAQGVQSVVSDHLGTPLSMYDEQGQATWEITLDSYGAVRQGRGRAQDCPFRYQGQYEDVETGLYYNRFRYYDPEAGNYISQDPLGLEGGTAFYAYVADPNTYCDPYGLKPCFTTQAGQEYAERIIKKYGGTLEKEGYYKFPNRRAARQTASEIAGDLDSKGTRQITRKPDFNGGPRTWADSEGRIGATNAKKTAGWRDDELGHDFGQGETVGPHVNAWNTSKGVGTNLHLVY